MMKISYIKLLLICFCLPSLLIGCQKLLNKTNQEQSSISTSNIDSEESSSGFSQVLKELDIAYGEFQPSLMELLDELEEVVKQKRPVNSAILNNTNKKLTIVDQAKQKIINDLQVENHEFSGLAIRTSYNMDVIIQDIFQVIEPLNNGFKQSDIRQIQKFLDFFDRRNISTQYYGTYGITTQEEVKKFLLQKNNQLKNKIDQLKQAINYQSIISNENNSNSVSPKNSTSLSLLSDFDLQIVSEQITLLEQENQNLNIEISQLKKSYNFVLILILINFAVIVLLLLYKLLSSSRTTNPYPAKAYNVTTNDISVIEEDIYTKISQQFSQKFKNIDKRINKIEGNSRVIDKIKNIAITNSEKDDIELQSPIYLESSESNPDYDITNPYDELTETYNQRPDLLSNDAINVSETEESIQARISGNSQIAILAQSDNGNYWILTVGEFYYLIPKINLIINKDQYNSLQYFFTCYGYQENLSSKLKLLKPARVSPSYDADTWEFVQQGIIEFESRGILGN